AYLLDPVTLGDLALDGCRRHVFALAGLEDVLHPPGNAQVARLIQLATITAVQPAILERFSGFLGFAVITLHQRLATQQNLATVTDAHLQMRHRPADGAETHLPRTIEAAVGEVLGHAVALANGHAQTLVPLQQPGGDCRSPRYEYPRPIQPQPCAD